MGGSFLQLVAKGFDDLYLTNNPQVTLFKMVYRRYINFSIFEDDILIKSGGNFSSKSIIKIDKKADLLHKLYVVVQLPKINLTKTLPTFNYITSILSERGVQWTYSNPHLMTDLVNVNIYNNSIVGTINEKITGLIGLYNFINTGIMFSSDGSNKTSLGGIANLICEELNRLEDPPNTLIKISKPIDYSLLKTNLINGRNAGVNLIYQMFTSYIKDYVPNITDSNGSIILKPTRLKSDSSNTQTLTNPAAKSLSLYNLETKTNFLTTGMLLGALKSYAYDSTMYNANYVYNNSGIIKSGIIETGNIINGKLSNNIISTCTITSTILSNNNITSGELNGKLTDPYMTTDVGTILTNMTLVNVSSYDLAENIIAINCAITNCTINVTKISGQFITGNITAGTITYNTISNFVIQNVTIGDSIVTGGSIQFGNVDLFVTNGKTIFEMAQIKSTDNVTTVKTLYGCQISNPTIVNDIITGGNLLNGIIQHVVFTNCVIKNVKYDPANSGIIISGNITGGTLIQNNVTPSTTLTDVIMLLVKTTDANNKAITKRTIINCSINVTIINGKITSGTITHGVVTTNVIRDVVITGATFLDGDITAGKLSNGNILNYSIDDVNLDITRGTINHAFLTNVQYVDSNGVIHSNVNFSNEISGADITYDNSITNAIVDNNLTNQIKIKDIATNSIDRMQSESLYSNILQRPSIQTNTNNTTTLFVNNNPSLTLLRLFNSDDLRYICYITYLNNITRVKIVGLDKNPPYSFSPTYSSFQQNLAIQISPQNLNILTPQLLSLDESILFYHVIDPNITIYNVYSFNVGQLTETYFDDNIHGTYDILDKYKSIIPVQRDSFTQTDAYMIYKLYMKNIINVDPVNYAVESSQQIAVISNSITINIDTNIRSNFAQLYQILNILYNGYRYMASSYIISFYRTFTFSITSGLYTASSGSSFTPIVGNSILTDNFSSVLNNVTPVQISSNEIVLNFFNQYINKQFNLFITLCQNQLRSPNYDSYMNYYPLWEKILFKNGTALLNAYSDATGGANLPKTTTFGNIALATYIPFAVVRDIPMLLYNTFNTYGNYIFTGLRNPSAPITPTMATINANFLSVIDYRDSVDAIGSTQMSDQTGVPYKTKKAIYLRIINNIFIANNFMSSPNGSESVHFLNDNDNTDYFTTLQSTSQGSTFLLCFTFRPDSFMVPSSKQDNTGNLIDLNLKGTTFSANTDMADMVFLPIEWLTQTYYNIFGSISDAFVTDNLSYFDNNGDQGLKARTQLRGLIANVINCFILNSHLPVLADYQNNKYSLLGLTTETNCVFQQYKKAIVSTLQSTNTPKYTDAISSIWYQTQKKMIQLYNRLFNNTLLSQDYYRDNLGVAMKSLYDYVNTQFTIASSTNIYHTATNPYPNRTPGTLLMGFNFGDMSTANNFSALTITPTIYPTISWPTELHPAINSHDGDVGFDMYRISNLIGSPPNIEVSSTAFDTINTFINDFTTLYSFMLSYYKQNRPILHIKNDTSNFMIYGRDSFGNLFLDASGNILKDSEVQITKPQFAYEQSSIINQYIEENVLIKYVNNITDVATLTILKTLAENTKTYWTPSFDTSGNYNNNGVFGVLDLLYNMKMSGNIIKTINKLSYIPDGNVRSDYINLSSFSNNPFSSFFLHDWYLDLGNGKSDITYETLTNAVLLFNSVVGSATYKLITSLKLANNRHISSLYMSTNKSPYGDCSVVANFLFDLFVTIAMSKLKTTFKFGQIISRITNVTTNGGYNDTVFTFNTVFKEALPTYITAYKQISTFINSTLVTTTENGFNQYLSVSTTNPDLNYYVSSNDTDLIRTDLETSILTIIKNSLPTFAWAKELGHKLIKKVDIKIGGQTFDSHSGELLHFINRIYKNSNQERGYNIMIGNTEEMYTISTNQRSITSLHIPLQFWFSRHVGNALPLLCMLYSDIEIILEMADLTDVLVVDSSATFIKPPKIKTKLLAQYIYLDEDERTRMANSKLEYLIETFNYNGTRYISPQNLVSSSNAQIISTSSKYQITDEKEQKIINPIASINLYLADPIKYLIWYIKFIDVSTPQTTKSQTTNILNWGEFGCNVNDASGNIISLYPCIKSITLMMNGTPRENPKSEDFYTYVAPYSRNISGLKPGEYMYSFALYPTLLQPSGTANFTELTNASIDINFTDLAIDFLNKNSNIKIKSECWGCAYKIFRIFSGFGALAFNK